MIKNGKKMIGKYEIKEKIGEGGMGKVFKAIHPTLKRHIIIKQLSIRSNKTLTQRFKREAQIMMDFRNDNIVQVYDHFKEGSSYYIAMEFVDGLSLEKLIQDQKQICPIAAILILREICKGLKHAHDKGVIHRDIKPDNVLISKSGEVKLVDFGIATAKEQNEDDLTRTTSVIGTPAYMSPEQLSSTKNVDKRSDIYSLGVLFYKMITGTRPFPTSFSAEAIEQITKGIFTKPEKLNPSIPSLFKKIIKKTMNSKINRRYKDLKGLINLLSRYAYKYNNQTKINQTIEEYLKDKSQESDIIKEKIKKKKNILLRICLIIIGVSFVIFIGLLFFERGYYHEMFKSREYGSIEIKSLLPEEYYKDNKDIYAIAILRNNEKKEWTFRLKSMQNDLFSRKEDKKLLTTKKKYLPAGIYNLEVILENRKYFKSFYLNPMVIQKQIAKTEKGEIIEFNLNKISTLLIKVSHLVKDSESGADLYKRTKILLKQGKTWTNWKNLIKSKKDKIKTDKIYTFKYELSSYYPKVIDVSFEEDKDLAQIQVFLMKKPGKLLLESDTKGLSIKIDGRKESYSGEEEKSFIKYGKTIIGKSEFNLPEGDNYFITIIKSGKILTDYQFEIASQKTTKLRISYKKDEKKIVISKSK